MKLKIRDEWFKEIEFKSDTPNYYKEESGNKSNTVRVIRPSDERRNVIERMLEIGKYGKIKIIHKQLPTEFFIRNISDVTWYNGCFIISWKDKKLSQIKKELKESDELLLEVLNQACGDGDGEIDNQCLSIYEEACNYLKKKGLLEEVNSRIYNTK